MKQIFKNCTVTAESVEAFLDRYYKPERFRGRGEEYAAALLASHEADFEKYGYDIISRHDSMTGQLVVYVGEGSKLRERLKQMDDNRDARREIQRMFQAGEIGPVEQSLLMEEHADNERFYWDMDDVIITKRSDAR